MKNKLATKSLLNSCLLATFASCPFIHTGLAQTAFPSVRVGDGTGSTATGDGTLVAEGKYGTSPLLSPIHQTTGSRMLWYPRKSAFRAGYGAATNWSEATMGPYSVATGYESKASGTGSTAMGYYMNTASGTGSTAMGYYMNTASGTASTAMGYYNTASGTGSTAMGYYMNTASGEGSTAMGYNNTASGFASTALGAATTASSFGETVIGSYNALTSGNPSSWSPDDPVFQIGNGHWETYETEVQADLNGNGFIDQDWLEYLPETYSNALTVYKNGNMELQGNLTLQGTITSAGSPVLTHASATDSYGYVSASNFNSKLAAAAPPTSAAWTSNYVPRGNVAPIPGQTIGGYLALGNSTASGQYSSAAGVGVTASGSYSSATGSGTTTASASYSRASGYNSLASALYSTANGNTSTATGFYSFSNGWGTSAKSSSEVVFGRYNLESLPHQATIAVNGLDGLFRLGNGISTARSDAMTVLKSGQTTLTNKDWKIATVATPTSPTALANPASTTDSDGNALVVDGHTILNGKVVISVPQGDISMGIYQ